MNHVVTNFGHSARERLKNLSKASGRDADYLYQRYAFERFYYRIGRSEYSTRFILKGASLFTLWMGPMFRVTQDTDLESTLTPDHEKIAGAFRAIGAARVPVDDGVVYDMSSMTVEDIKKQDVYKGVRVKFDARLEQARIVLQFDIGFGDSIYPKPEVAEYPTLLGGDPPVLMVYTAVAEKYRAMVELGMANSRLKDYFDLWALAGKFQFDFALLQTAVKRSFARSGIAVPSNWPVGLRSDFFDDEAKKRQWSAFLRKIKPQSQPESLGVAVRRIRDLLKPVIFQNVDAVVATWSPQQSAWINGR